MAPWWHRTRAKEVDAEVYTRRDCPLCEKAIQELRRHGIRPRLIDVDTQPRLQQRYGDCVPVVVLEGKIRFRGHVNPILLRRLLRARRRP